MSTKAKAKRSEAGKRRQKPPAKKHRGRPSTYLRSKVELAEGFGVSSPTIDKWLTNGAPKKRAKGYKLAEWTAWVLTRASGGTTQQESHDSAPTELEQARAQRERTRAELDQLRLDNARGVFVPRTDYERDRCSWVRYFVAQLERLPSELVTKLAAKSSKSVKQVVEDHVRGVRTRMVAELTQGDEVES